MEHCYDRSKALSSAQTQGPTKMSLQFVLPGHQALHIQIIVLEFINQDPKSQDAVAWR